MRGARRGCTGRRLRRGGSCLRITALEERGISVKRDVLREDAARVLRDYANSGGEVYNARQETSEMRAGDVPGERYG